MFIVGTNENEITNIVTMLRSSFSEGNDDISSKIVKNVIIEIASPLSMAFNASLSTETFPDKLKIAKIVPIYKSDDRLLVNNYRPISFLQFFSKILERMMYNRLLKFLNDNNIQINNQYGFREGHSTYMALLRMVNDITKEMDNKNFAIGIFIDLSKAFDTVDHSLLINKCSIMESEASLFGGS